VPIGLKRRWVGHMTRSVAEPIFMRSSFFVAGKAAGEHIQLNVVSCISRVAGAEYLTYVTAQSRGDRGVY
jgi:hypothetical protein